MVTVVASVRRAAGLPANNPTALKDVEIQTEALSMLHIAEGEYNLAVVDVQTFHSFHTKHGTGKAGCKQCKQQLSFAAGLSSSQ